MPTFLIFTYMFLGKPREMGCADYQNNSEVKVGEG
jgi:hypothetical protein